MAVALRAVPVQAVRPGLRRLGGRARGIAVHVDSLNRLPSPQARLAGARLESGAKAACEAARGVRGRCVAAKCAASAAVGSASPGPLDLVTISGVAAALARVRALLFYLVTVTLSLPLFVSMVLITPFQLAFDKYRRAALHFVNDVWATCSTSLFYRVEVRGAENLPGPDEPAVYVANHQSYLDIYSLFHLRRPFKFISKTSNFLIPIIGWSMYLTGHVPLKRMDRRSQMECLNACRELLKNKAPVLFFPEGTRSASGRMAEFKKGAFTVAAKEQVPAVPITLDGTGRLMRNGKEHSLFPGKVVITVHPRIKPGDADEMCAQAQAAIESALPEEYRYKPASK